MGVFQRFSTIFQEKANAAADKMEDPSQAIDLSYQQMLEQQQKMRTALVEATTGQKRLQNMSSDLDAKIAKLNEEAQTAVAQGREDLATQALSQSEALNQQKQNLAPQLASITAQVQNLTQGVQKFQERITAFSSQRETLKAQYEASQATNSMGSTLAGIGEHANDAALMMQRAQDKIAHSTAHADAVDSLLASGALDTPGMPGSDPIGSQLSAQLAQSSVQAKLAQLKAAAGLPAGTPPAAPPAALPTSGIVVRIHADAQYRLDASLKEQLTAFDNDLVAAVDKNDEAAYHRALGGVISFVKTKGAPLPSTDMSASDIILPSDDMSLDEVKTLLNTGLQTPATAGATA